MRNLFQPILATICMAGFTMASRPVFARSAAPDILWQKSYGGSGTEDILSVRQLDDGNFVFAGKSGKQVWLLKADASGDTLVNLTISAGDAPWASSVRPTSDGGYIITGSTAMFGISGSNLWVYKTNSLGKYMWSQTLNGVENGADHGYTVEQTRDDGFIVYARTVFGGLPAVWLLKFDAAGDTLWTKIYHEVVGSSDHELALTPDGGYVFTGQTPSKDLLIMKTDGDGNTVWSRTYDGGDADAGKSIAVTADGGYIVTGYTTVSGESANLWLLKIDADGNEVWAKIYGGARYDEGRCVQQTADGGYFITGMTMSSGAGGMDAWMLKTDASGDTSWTMTWGNEKNDQCYSGQQTDDGGYIVSAYTNSFSPGNVDGWLIRLAPDHATSGGHCMFVRQADNAETTPLDEAMMAHLTSWGYTVEEHIESDLRFYTDADYADFDFIFVSESIASGNAVHLINVPKPMLLSEGRAAKESAMAFTVGEPCGMPDGEPIVFLDEGAGHPLAAGYTPGTVLSLCDSTYLINWCQPTIPIIPIAGLESDPTKMLIYGVESGTLLADNATRTQNRVAVIGVHAWGYTSFTEAAIKLYQAGIEWVLAGSGTTVEDEIQTPGEFALARNYPNPFNPATTIPYHLKAQSHVELSIYDVTGREIKTLVNQQQIAGEHAVIFDASDLTSGVYYYRLKTDAFEKSHKMILLK